MFYEAADLELYSETTHFDRLKRRHSTIRGSQDSLREQTECWFVVVNPMRLVSSALGLLSRDSPIFVDNINLVKVCQK